MNERHTRKYISRIQQILYYPQGKWPYGYAHQMMPVADMPKGSGQFFFDGKDVSFHEDDAKIEKFIVYESVEQVQRTVRRMSKVRLRP